MTSDQQPQAPVQQPKPVVRKKVDPASDSRLATLLTAHKEAKERAAAAAAEADELQSQITAEVLATVPEGGKVPDAFDIAADPHGGYPAYTYRYTPPGWGIDSKRMKSEDPEEYVKWAKRREGYWTFEAKRAGKQGRR